MSDLVVLSEGASSLVTYPTGIPTIDFTPGAAATRASTEDWLNGTAQINQLSDDGRKKTPSREGLQATRR